MKKRMGKKKVNLPGEFSFYFSNRPERQVFLASVRQLDEQSDRLGILDPLETEPALLYSPWEGEK